MIWSKKVRICCNIYRTIFSETKLMWINGFTNVGENFVMGKPFKDF